MANETSSNKTKKTGKQIKNSGSKTTKKKTSTAKKTTTVKKTTTAKKTTSTRDKVVVAPAKKKTTTTKKTTTSNKSVREDVVVSPSKTSPTKTIEQEKIKNDLKSTKTTKEKVQVVAPRSKKKDLASEVDKILEIDSFEKKEVVDTPKFIQEEKSTIPEFEVKENLETKIKDFLEKEDLKEREKPSTTSLDEVDVIKFEKKKTTIKPKSSQLKKKTSGKEKTMDLDQIDKIHEYAIVEELKKDVSKKEKTQEFTRKRKGKGYVVDIKKKPSYKELEDDLRSLYDTVTDVVEDFDGTATPDVIESQKKKKTSIFFGKKQKPSKKPVVTKTTPGKKTKIVKETVIADVDTGERPSFLDRISQNVLNKFLVLLLIIFSIMVVGFILFVIYVSTF